MFRPPEGRSTMHKMVSLPSVLFLIYSSFVNCTLVLNNRTHPCTIKEKKMSLVFDCQERHLETIPPPFNYSASSVALLLSNNYILTVPKNAFQKWSNLTKVDLSWNSVKSNPYTTDRVFIIEKEAFVNQTKLMQLFISSNNLHTVPPGLPISLRMLHLQDNNILSVNSDSFSTVKYLKQLYLDHNCYYGNNCSEKLEIQEGTFLQLKDLTILSLSYNNLNKVPSNLPPSLQELYLKNNNIHTIEKDDFMNLTQLKILHLSGNCPRCFNAPYACKACPNRSALEIHPNAFQYLKKLVELNLGNTSLKTVLRDWFQNLTKLKVLNLQKNYLVNEMASGDFFLSLSSLQILDLSFNFEKGKYFQYLNLSDNFSKLISLQELHVQGYVFQKITNVTFLPLLKIKTLNVINFGTNFIKLVNLTLFHHFPSLTMIYLSENRISPFPVKPNESKNSLKRSRRSAQNNTMSNILDNLIDYPIENNNINNRRSGHIIKPICASYGKTLDLSYNTMFFISKDDFLLLSDIVCLNLSHNSLDQDFSGVEFVNLPNLTYLDLSYNKLDFDSSSAFQELRKLQVLDISYNAKYFIVEGVTHNLNFISNLPNLKVLNISYNKISALTEYQVNKSGIEELRFAGNLLNRMWGSWKPNYNDIFKNFTNLKILDISLNNLQRFSDIMAGNLPRNLKTIYLNNNYLKYWEWKTLRYFKHLTFLDLSHNKLKTIEPNLSAYTSSLQKLLLNKNRISQLTASFLYKAASLTELDLSDNQIQTINNSVFLSGNDNFLKVLWLNGNPFDCTCDIIDFLQWIDNSNVIIPQLATGVTCESSDLLRRKSILQFDRQACSLDSVSMMLCFLSFFLVVLVMALPIMKHLFYWDLWYIYHWCMAKLKPNKIVVSKTLYDAFITYDDKDPNVSDWVYNELCQQLEQSRDRHILLCLEERDWEPGKAVVDNIAQSINQSKKTVFILTKKYVRSGKFRTVFYLAMQKLMDENMDVIVIVLLQPVLQNSQYLRLRKKICASSILEWPAHPHEEHIFWQKMKNVLLTENTSRYNNLYTNPLITE